LRGLIDWRLRTEFHERLTVFDKNLRNLDVVMADAEVQYRQYVRSRQAATHSYEGYTQPVNALRRDSQEALEKIDRLASIFTYD